MDMKQLIEKFPAQLREAMTIGETFKATSWPHEIKNVLVTGLEVPVLEEPSCRSCVKKKCPFRF